MGEMKRIWGSASCGRRVEIWFVRKSRAWFVRKSRAMGREGGGPIEVAGMPLRGGPSRAVGREGGGPVEGAGAPPRGGPEPGVSPG